MSGRLFVLGSINTDLVINTPYIPNQGETLIGSGFFTAHGGKGANQAVAAARSGAKVLMCGAVGDDEFGKSARQSLLDEGIDCSFVKTVKNCPSGVAVIVVNNGAYNARLYDFVWTPKLNYDSSGRYVFQNWTNTTPTASANRDCNGKYLGYIKHNTMKHVVYTQRPSSEEMYFLSAFCYNGHILGLHGVKGIFPQLASKTVAVGDPSLTSTRDCFMANFIDNSPRRLYDEINAKYRKTHGGASIVDNGLYPIHKNAYIAAMTAKFWMAFLLPENDKQTEFKAHYEYDTNATVQYLKGEYAKGRDSYYYRIVPRRFEWVTNFGTGYSDSPLSSEMAALDEKDPYCTDTDCLDSKTDNNALNDYLRTNYTFGESMSGCV